MIWKEIVKAINSTVNKTPAESKPLNELLINRVKIFTNSGVFKVPLGVSSILVTAISQGGDGGNGGTAQNQNFTQTTSGGGGACGQYVVRAPLIVTPNETINVTFTNGNVTIKNIYLQKGNNGEHGAGIFGTSQLDIPKGGIATAGGNSGENGALNTLTPGVSGGKGGNSPREIAVLSVGFGVGGLGGISARPTLQASTGGLNGAGYGSGGGGGGAGLSQTNGGGNTGNNVWNGSQGGKGGSGIVILEW